jgi:uncharacterized protein
MSKFLLVLVISVLSAAQESTLTPARQPQRPQIGKASPLSASEVSRLKSKAEAGDASAQALLGKAYKDGDGVQKNETMALKWLRKAADQDEPAAENDLGIIYGRGEGIAQDKDEAARWYKKAAKQGNAKAMFNLGACYYNGDGVDTDNVASYAWFLLAQEAGSSAADEALKRKEDVSENAAYLKIAEMYQAGEDLPKKPMEALKWYRKAADSGDPRASVKVAGVLLSLSGTRTEAEYGEVRQRCEDAARRNFSGGAYCLVLIYRRGIGTPVDLVESANWLGRATELGYSKASLELGEAYWKGTGVKADPVAAYMWIWLALNAKVSGAQQDEQALAKELSPQQVQQAKQKANEWSKRHQFVGLRELHPESALPTD